MINKHFPSYPDDADYTTNASSYYNDLARKQKLIQLLSEKIWKYENTLNETLEQIEKRLTDYILENDILMNERLENWDKRIEEMPEEMKSLFVVWLNDGTLEKIINHDVLGNKADQSELDETNAHLADLITDPTFKASTETESAVLGSELITASGWVVPTGWTGNFETGFKNTVGNLNPLIYGIPDATATKLYQVYFRVESPTPAGVPNASTDFAVTLGNSEEFVTYQGGGTFDYTFGIRSVSNGNLAFIPYATFDGTIKNVSVKEVIGIVEPSLEIINGNGQPVFELRTGGAFTKNVFIGKDSGHYNTTGTENVAVGDRALADNTTGYWNTALGAQALEKNATGSRNIAVGFLSLQENISGDRNISLGTFTMMRNKHGRQNIALGADSLWENTTGSRNIAIGMASMPANVSGNENIAIGFAPLNSNTTGSGNIAIGFSAMDRNKIGDNNVAIGRDALKRTLIGINTAIGYASASYNETGISNTVVGASALSTSKAGQLNAVFGHYAAGGGAFGDGISESAIFGANAGNKLTTGGDGNTIIGFSAGSLLTTGMRNIIIGRNAGQELTAESNRLIIGDLLYGYINTGDGGHKRLGIGVKDPTAKLHIQSASGGANSVPIKINAGSLVTVKEPGAIEYNGVDLYFTDNNGVRHKLLKEVV